MFWKRKDSGTDEKDSGTDEEDRGARALLGLMRGHMPDADEETVRIVAAVAGLLAGVAYADRDFSTEEAAKVEQELSRIQGLSAAGPRAVCAALRAHVLELSATQAPRYTRALRQLADRELRVEVLGVLVELAAADRSITVDEVNHLRRTTQALGLSQDDYNALQSRHRDKLSSLR